MGAELRGLLAQSGQTDFMKILHIISQHPESTGSGFSLQNIIRQAKIAGHQNALVAGITAGRIPELDCIGEQFCRFVSFGEGRLNFAVPGMSDVMPYNSSIFGHLTADQLDSYEQVFTETVRSAVASFAPDIIHSHHLWLVSSLSRRAAADIPMVTSCHSTDLRQFVQCPHLRQRVLLPCREIDRILALSRDQQERITEIYGIAADRIDIVGGGYDDEMFAPHKKEKPGTVELLYAGKLSFAKGVDWLLHVFHQLQGQGMHLHLAGSGTGEEARICLELAERAGTAVSVHGRISQQKLAELMGRCHVFILPSFFEGLPLVLLEALASGCRIVTTDLPGCRELLAGADPDLVEIVRLPSMKNIDRPEQSDLADLQKKLAAALISMAGRVRKSPSPSAGQICRITSRFSWNSVFSRIFAAYEQAVAKKGGD